MAFHSHDHKMENCMRFNISNAKSIIVVQNIFFYFCTIQREFRITKKSNVGEVNYRSYPFCSERKYSLFAHLSTVRAIALTYQFENCRKEVSVTFNNGR